MNSYDFLSCSLFGNDLFQSKGRCLLYSHWLKSSLIYVKDLFDEKVEFISEQTLFEKLKCKSNWLIEMTIIKTILLKYVRKYNFDVTLSKFVKIKSTNNMFILNDSKKN